MSDIDDFTAGVYADGTDPIDWAIRITENLLMLHHEVTVGRAADPSSFPGLVGDFTREGTARRIIGDLLAAGWSPPSEEQIRQIIKQNPKRAAALRATAARLRLTTLAEEHWLTPEGDYEPTADPDELAIRAAIREDARAEALVYLAIAQVHATLSLRQPDPTVATA